MVLDLFTDPDSFFRRRSADPGYLRPVLIVTAVALVGVLGSIPAIRLFLDALPESAGTFVVLVQGVSAAITFVATFVQWGLYSLAFFAIAKLAFDGSGSFGETAALVGWGFVPLLFGAIVNAAASAYVYSTVTFPGTTDPARIQQFATRIQSDPVIQGASLLGIAFLLWSGFLWVLAVQHGQDVRPRSAVITVAIPLLVGLLLRIPGLL